MHMADALISPAVGGVMWAATAGTIAYAARKVRQQTNDRIVPLMGVTGAFVFAAQMINFGIPGTGSSGHIGGGLLLAALLGPHAAFIVIASILAIQALFFADGGLLALGANIFNLGMFPCFLAYPFIFKPLMKDSIATGRLFAAAIPAAAAGLLLGALGVVIETVASGITALPFSRFVLLMLPIHLAIGIVEGLATAAVLGFVWKARPELARPLETGGEPVPVRKVVIGLAAAALVVAGLVSWFASTHPDGLEWSIERVTGSPELESGDSVHAGAAAIQEKTAILPDYSLPAGENETAAGENESGEAWPAVSGGTSLAGIIGSLMVLGAAVLLGFILRIRRPAAAKL